MTPFNVPTFVLLVANLLQAAKATQTTQTLQSSLERRAQGAPGTPCEGTGPESRCACECFSGQRLWLRDRAPLGWLAPVLTRRSFSDTLDVSEDDGETVVVSASCRILRVAEHANVRVRGPFCSTPTALHQASAATMGHTALSSQTATVRRNAQVSHSIPA